MKIEEKYKDFNFIVEYDDKLSLSLYNYLKKNEYNIQFDDNSIEIIFNYEEKYYPYKITINKYNEYKYILDVLYDNGGESYMIKTEKLKELYNKQLRINKLERIL